ncbi:MAG: transporter [Luteolibacter sp.]|nr:transporter [Luteolibacter sp.]
MLASSAELSAQELEPRRWGHLPLGVNFAGLGYIRTEGDIALDPVLRLTDVEVELDTAALKYIRTFGLFGKSARFDLVQAYQEGEWTGLLNDAPAAAQRSGFTDTSLRFAINLFGAPPLEGAEFAQYRAGLKSDTIIGAGLIVTLPTGEYFSDKLINLGENRYSIRPQVGVVHERGKWSFEFTGATWFFTENDDFFGGMELEQDPLVTMQGHVIHTFRPGLWLGASLGYDFGGQSTVNGDKKDDSREILSWGVTCGVSVSRSVGFKFGYIDQGTRRQTGSDLGHFVAAVSVMW